MSIRTYGRLYNKPLESATVSCGGDCAWGAFEKAAPKRSHRNADCAGATARRWPEGRLHHRRRRMRSGQSPQRRPPSRCLPPQNESHDRNHTHAWTPPRLSVSIVLFESDLDLFRQTVDALAIAIRHATDAGLVARRAHCDHRQLCRRAAIASTTNGIRAPRPAPSLPVAHWRRIAGQGNVGFGRGHNVALLDRSDDRRLPPGAESGRAAGRRRVDSRACAGCATRPTAALVAPNARTAGGAPLFLCKRYPDAFTLLLRAAAPRSLRRWFAARLARYELRDVVGSDGEQRGARRAARERLLHAAAAPRSTASTVSRIRSGVLRLLRGLRPVAAHRARRSLAHRLPAGHEARPLRRPRGEEELGARPDVRRRRVPLLQQARLEARVSAGTIVTPNPAAPGVTGAATRSPSVLVTGAYGFIGRAYCAHLAAQRRPV